MSGLSWIGFKVDYWRPWIAFHEDMAKLLKLDPENIDKYYRLEATGNRSVFRFTHEENGETYYSFIASGYETGSTPTGIYFNFEHLWDPSIPEPPLEVEESLMSIEVKSNEIHFHVKPNHFVDILDKEGRSLYQFKEFILPLDDFLDACLMRERLVEAKSHLCSLSIPNMPFVNYHYSQDHKLESGTVNGNIFLDKNEDGTVFIEFPQEGHFQPLQRLKKRELALEIKDRETGQFIQFWTGFTLACFHFRHKLFNSWSQ